MANVALLLDYIGWFESFFWSYIGIATIFGFGLYLMVRTHGFQFHTLWYIASHLRELHRHHKQQHVGSSSGKIPYGSHPLALYFISVGGSVGLTNVASIVTAITIGGPGGIVWIWVTSVLGMLIKYCEIYLGVVHRVRNAQGGYDGGPMYYLQAAFSRRYIPILCCLLMCVYATDVAQFSILLDSVNGYTTGQSRGLLATAMAVFLLLLAWRGVHKIASLSLLCMPPLLVIYVGCCLYVLAMHGRDFGPTLALVWKSAFEGYAPLGGFLGSSLLLTIQQGTTMAVYTGDIGLGFDASVQSESRIQHAPAQARLAILALASDMIICTLTCLVVLTTGVWTQLLEPSQYVGVAFNQLIPWGSYFVDLLLLISGFTSVTIYLAIGLKSSRFLHYHYGPLIFSLYSVMALIVFSFYSQVQLLSVMASCCGLLMICNVLGIWKLRHEIVFRE